MMACMDFECSVLSTRGPNICLALMVYASARTHESNSRMPWTYAAASKVGRQIFCFCFRSRTLHMDAMASITLSGWFVLSPSVRGLSLTQFCCTLFTQLLHNSLIQDHVR